MSDLEQSINILAIGAVVVSTVFFILYYGMVGLRKLKENLGWE